MTPSSGPRKRYVPAVGPRLRKLLFVVFGLFALLGVNSIYLAGVTWLAMFLAGTGSSEPWATALSAGLVPFLLGDAVKLLLAAAALPVAWRLVRRWRP